MAPHSTQSGDVTPHPPDPRGPRFPFGPAAGGGYWLTDGYGYGARVSWLRYRWQQIKRRLGVLR